MKKLILLFAFISLVGFVNAQQHTFSEVLYSNSYSNSVQAYAGVIINDTSFFVVGQYDNAPLIIKMDTAGSIIWSKTFGSKGILNSIISTTDSNFVLAGNIYNSSDNGYDVLCMKINAAGDTIWKKDIDMGYNEYVYSVQQTNDKGFILSGYTQVTSTSSKIIVIKLDSNGNLSWGKILASGQRYNCAYSIKQVPDSGYVAVGYINDSLYNYYYYANSLITKISKSGNIEWSKISTQEPGCIGYDVTLTNNNSFLFYLSTGDNIGVFMLTDTAGNIKWRNNYDNLSGQYSQPKEYPKFHNTIDNKYIITVPQYNWQGFSSMIKIDTTGNISLINVMGVSASDIMEQKDKSYMVIGNGPDTIYVTKPANVPTTPEIGIIKVDSLGKGINCVESLSLSPQSYSFNLTSDTIVSQSAGQNKNIGLASSNVSLNVTSGCVQTVMIGSVKNIERNNSILIYPNPVTDKINVISNQCSVNGVEICNILGEKIYQSLVTSHLLSGMSPMTNAPMTSSPIAINVADLTSGVYFIKATTEKGVVVKKFIKQ